MIFNNIEKESFYSLKIDFLFSNITCDEITYLYRNRKKLSRGNQHELYDKVFDIITKNNLLKTDLSEIEQTIFRQSASHVTETISCKNHEGCFNLSKKEQEYLICLSLRGSFLGNDKLNEDNTVKIIKEYCNVVGGNRNEQ